MEANKSTGLQDAHTTYLFSAGPELETSFFLSFFFLLLHLLLLLSSSDFYKPILFAQKPYHFFYKKTPCSTSELGVDNFLYFLHSGWKTPHPKNQNQEIWMLLNFHLNMSTRDHWVEQNDLEFIHDLIAQCEQNSNQTLWSMMTLSSVNWFSSKHFDPWWHCPVWTEFHPNVSTHDDIAQCELSFIQKLSSMMGLPVWVSSKHIWPMMGWWHFVCVFQWRHLNWTELHSNTLNHNDIACVSMGKLEQNFIQTLWSMALLVIQNGQC